MKLKLIRIKDCFCDANAMQCDGRVVDDDDKADG